MKVSILFFAKLRDLAGVRDREAVAPDGSTLGDLVEQFCREYGADFRHQIETSKGLRIMVNGRENEILQGLLTELKDGDTVTFFPLVFGG
jgi:molybdopterin synthase sulfur carrier subunit